jgi:hypothetical protein
MSWRGQSLFSVLLAGNAVTRSDVRYRQRPNERNLFHSTHFIVVMAFQSRLCFNGIRLKKVRMNALVWSGSSVGVSNCDRTWTVGTFAVTPRHRFASLPPQEHMNSAHVTYKNRTDSAETHIYRSEGLYMETSDLQVCGVYPRLHAC